MGIDFYGKKQEIFINSAPTNLSHDPLTFTFPFGSMLRKKETVNYFVCVLVGIASIIPLYLINAEIYSKYDLYKEGITIFNLSGRI